MNRFQNELLGVWCHGKPMGMGRMVGLWSGHCRGSWQEKCASLDCGAIIRLQGAGLRVTRWGCCPCRDVKVTCWRRGHERHNVCLFISGTGPQDYCARRALPFFARNLRRTMNGFPSFNGGSFQNGLGVFLSLFLV